MLMPFLALFFLVYILFKVFITFEPQSIPLIYKLCVTMGLCPWRGAQVFCPEGGAENPPAAYKKLFGCCS